MVNTKEAFKEIWEKCERKRQENDVQYDVKFSFKSLHNYRTDKYIYSVVNDMNI